MPIMGNIGNVQYVLVAGRRCLAAGVANVSRRAGMAITLGIIVPRSCSCTQQLLPRPSRQVSQQVNSVIMAPGRR